MRSTNKWLDAIKKFGKTIAIKYKPTLCQEITKVRE